MRLTERELTVALEGAAKSVLAAQDKQVRKGRRTADDAWAALTKYQRYQMLERPGQPAARASSWPCQMLEVAIGSRPTPPTPRSRRRSGSAAARSCAGLRGKVLLKARVALVQLALSHVPPRADPDALIVPDHL